MALTQFKNGDVVQFSPELIAAAKGNWKETAYAQTIHRIDSARPAGVSRQRMLKSCARVIDVILVIRQMHGIQIAGQCVHSINIRVNEQDIIPYVPPIRERISDYLLKAQHVT